MSTERKTIGLGLLSIAGAIDDAQYMPGQLAGDPDDIDRLNKLFVAGDITLNEYVRKLESLEKLAKGRTEEQQ